MKVAVLLSGGVDSSVALRLLQQQGHEVTAFYLKIWLEDELSFLGECPWEEDLHFARRICQQAGVDLEVISLQREYHQKVVAWAIDELREGRTPSPDVLCNQHIKFGAFLDILRDRLTPAFDKVASGHYARVRAVASTSGSETPAEFELLKGVDPVKDQTYFLYQLNQDQLQRCLFPLGGYSKTEVRALAEEMALVNSERKDSQGICFLGKIQYDQFVRAHLGEKRGAIKSVETGETMGSHSGHWFFTIGQRKGLGLGGGPWYVVAKSCADNVIWISHRENFSDHHRDRFFIPAMHWIGSPLDPGTHKVGVRIRHSPQIAQAQLTVPTRAADPMLVELSEADPGVAAGQAAVVYQEEKCLGGGQIQLAAHPTDID